MGIDSNSPAIHYRPIDEFSSANRVYIMPSFGFRSSQIYLLHDYPGMNMYSLSPGVWTSQPESGVKSPQDIPPSAKLSDDGLAINDGSALESRYPAKSRSVKPRTG